MVKAQEWLENNCSQETKEIYLNEQLEGALDLANFNNLEKILISYLIDKNQFEITNKRKETKLIQLKNAQEWLDQRYPVKNANPSKRRNRVDNLDISNKELEGSLDLTSFTNLKKLYCNDNKLTALKLSNLVKLETVFCFKNQLTNLETNGLNNLECLNSKINNLSNLNSLLSNLDPTKLKQLYLRNNNFSESNLTPLSKFTNLEYLEIANNFSQQGKNNFYRSLKSLQSLTNLESLYVIDSASEKNIYCSNNKKDGSVISQIKKLTKFNLEWLDNNYPQESRSETKEIYLNEPNLEGELDLGEFTHKNGIKVYVSLEVDTSKLVIKNLPASAEIIETVQAQKYIDQKYSTPTAKVNCQHLNIGVKNENNPWGIAGKHLAGSLSLKGFTNLIWFACNGQNITSLDLTDCVNLKNLYCENNQLTSLDLSSCPNLEELFCWNNQLTQLNLKNQTKLVKLSCAINQFAELDVSACSNLSVLKCWTNKLTNLDLTSCPQLTELYCYKNQLTQLTLPPKLPNLEQLNCSDNLLANLDFATMNEEKLTLLYLGSNNFSIRDLTSLVKFINLRELDLGNLNRTQIKQGIINRWTGSLAPLRNMQQLQVLGINNTDLDSGLEYLPASIREICCSHLEKPNSKVKLITQELKKNGDFISVSYFTHQVFLRKNLNPELFNRIKDFNHRELNSEQETLLANLVLSKRWREHYKANGLCVNCQQLKGDFVWCQPCEIQDLRADFAKWTSGNSTIDKFIQKSQLEATSRYNALEWIPYEQFSNIEHLADGGFGKVYKVNWVKAKNNNRTFALKSLINSQNITSEFLSEIINTKLTDGSNSNLVVPCWGISQDPVTKNYLMLMMYMSEGNLREYLSKNYSKLKFEDKFLQLSDITQGLFTIHEANLMHQDFHSGNVLNLLQNNHVSSLISDLGLSRPAGEKHKEGEIYGVLPYVAPEVLQGKPHTQASDIYSWGMIAYEILSGSPPYHDRDYDTSLALTICQGLRPNLQEVIAPQLLKDLIISCWDAEPEQRLGASELLDAFHSWTKFTWIVMNNISTFSIDKNTSFYHQYQALLPEIDLPTKPLFSHSADKYTSKPINTKQISELLKNLRLTDTTSFQLTKVIEQIKKIEEKIKTLKEPLEGEQKQLVDQFIEIKKQSLKNREDKQVWKKANELEERLEEENISEENIEKIIDCCKRLVELEQQLEPEQLQTQVEIPTSK
jgi:Leucine-rich repeat (LRR) protein